jgi:hypothetical protein
MTVLERRAMVLAFERMALLNWLADTAHFLRMAAMEMERLEGQEKARQPVPDTR